MKMKVKVKALSKELGVLLILLATLTTAQAPIRNTVDECIQQQGYYFCTPEVQLDNPVNAMQFKGSCCLESELEAYSETDKEKCTASDNPIRGIQCTQPVPFETFVPAQRFLFDSYSLGMLYDRSQVCPTIEDRNSLDAYLEVSSDPVSISMD